jgi:molybdenum cofactor synthesis domain-containing protein
VATVRAAVLTISTSVSRGEKEDTGGPLLADLAREAGAEVVAVEVLPDDAEAISARLRHHAQEGCTFVFTTGGTGFTPDDVTPEATRAVIERPAPGFAEAMRAKSLEFTPLGILTRGESGIVGRTLVLNFPGNPKALRQLFPVVAPTLKHVAATLHRDAGGPTPGH